MFTLLPSLYLIGVHYFRQRNKENNIPKIENQVSSTLNIDQAKYDTSESETKTTIDRHRRTKSNRKRSHRQRQKDSINDLTDDDIEYLMQETGFTREEILLWYADFLRDCPDGKLTKKKFIEIYQQFYKKGHVTKFCDYAFRLFDKDRSGYMDFVEFLIAVSLVKSKDPAKKIKFFFSMFDLDRNHLIDENEMRSAIEAIYEMMGIDISDPTRIDTKVNEIFSKAECDRAGYLRRDQFSIACQNDRHIRKLFVPNATLSKNQSK